MKAIVPIIPVVLLLGPLSLQAAAGPPPINRLTPARVQEFSRDLIPSSSQAFFNAGRDQLEQEIQLLSQRQQLRQNLLKVNPSPPTPPDPKLNPVTVPVPPSRQ